MTYVAFKNSRTIVDSPYGMSKSCIKEYDGKTFDLKKYSLDLFHNIKGVRTLVSKIPINNLLAVSTSQCMHVWNINASCDRLGAPYNIKFMLIDDPSKEYDANLNATDFGCLNDYMVIEVAVENFDDIRYILLRKDKFSYEYMKNILGVPILCVKSNKGGVRHGVIIIPSDKIVDIQDMKYVNTENDLTRQVTHFNPKTPTM